jgi:hypothetical protein
MTSNELNKNNSLTLMHYKEPLSPIPKKFGVGYYGAIQVTLDGEKIQCHMCGGLFTRLNFHLRNVHFVEEADYKTMYQLEKTTALVSEKERERCKIRTMKWMLAMPLAKRREWQRKRLESLKKWLKENPGGSRKKGDVRLETKNKRGTCPEQLKDKIRKMADKLKRPPRKQDFIDENDGGNRYLYMFKATFGSFNNAVKAAGLKPHERYVYKEGKKTWRSDEELLDALSLFWREQDKIPTETDFRRGFIPDPRIYRKRFGTMQRARELAGIQ